MSNIRTLAARDAVYGAAMAAFRLPSDAPTVEELIEDIRQAHSDTLVAAEKRNAEGLTTGQYLAVGDLVYWNLEESVIGTIFELRTSVGVVRLEDLPTNDWREALIRFTNCSMRQDFIDVAGRPSYILQHQRGKSLVLIVKVMPIRVSEMNSQIDVEMTVRNLRFKQEPRIEY